MHGRPYRSGSWFTRFAKSTARAAGHPATFCVAVAIIVLWAATGPFFGFSDTWQLVINTGTTIVTFLMVFLIQNTQNRDSEAIQVKLDELIRSIEGAHLALLDLEELDDKDLDRICSDYRELAQPGAQGSARRQDGYRRSRSRAAAPQRDEREASPQQDDRATLAMIVSTDGTMARVLKITEVVKQRHWNRGARMTFDTPWQKNGRSVFV